MGVVRTIAAGVFACAVVPAVADPSALLGREWQVVSIDGERPPAMAQVSIAFLPDGRIAGRSGCNRYGGSVMADVGTITVGPLVGTRMACAPQVMAVESRFLGILETVTSYSVTGNTLVLSASNGQKIEAQRGPAPR